MKVKKKETWREQKREKDDYKKKHFTTYIWF